MISFGGAFCSFFIGAAFATGQETMQFFTSFGFSGLMGMFASLLLFLYCGMKIQATAYTEQFAEMGHVFEYYLGKWIGTFYRWFMVAMLYIGTTMMLSGVGAVFEEYFKLPGMLGRGLVLAAVSLTVLLGLSKILDVLGFIGPLIVGYMVLLGALSLIMSDGSIAEGMDLAPALDIYRGAGSAAMAAAKYALVNSTVLITLWVSCGSRMSDVREAKAAAGMQVAMFGMACILLVLAQFKNIGYIYGSEIPNLFLAKRFAPALAIGLAIVMTTGIYSGATMGFWYVTRAFSHEGTAAYRIITAVMAAVSFFASGAMPFSRIMNLMYTSMFLLGAVMVASIIRKSVMNRKKA
ncbi:MAG: hypothetical protein E7230_01310 [Clostridiales bacterium]|nr:hypothetical protein [Clostridiales bacterium]